MCIVCISIHMYSLNIHIQKYTYIHMCIFIYMYTCIQIYVYICVFLDIFVHVYTLRERKKEKESLYEVFKMVNHFSSNHLQQTTRFCIVLELFYYKLQSFCTESVPKLKHDCK